MELAGIAPDASWRPLDCGHSADIFRGNYRRGHRSLEKPNLFRNVVVGAAGLEPAAR